MQRAFKKLRREDARLDNDSAPGQIEQPPVQQLEGRSSPLKTNNLGLRQLWAPDHPSTAIADVVFLHGLTGDSYRTWLHQSSGIHWPSTFLCQDIPDVRILAFGYDADVVNSWSAAGQDRVGTHAQNLLSSLADKRDETESTERPIIVVGHSLGGLVAANALNITRYSTLKHISNVGQHIRAMLFLGTPHYGSDLAAWAALGTRIASTLKHTNKAIVNLLERDSEVLAGIQDGFAHALESRKERGQPIVISCFIESKPVSGIGLVCTGALPLTWI